MNKLSKKLRGEIPEFDSKKSFSFHLLGVKYDRKLKRLIVPSSKNVPNEDSIFDEGAGKMIPIYCEDRKVSAGVHSDKEFNLILKKILFTRDEDGIKVLRGKNKKQQALFEYLFLSNYNEANRGKSWFIEPKGGCIYKFVEPEKRSEDQLGLEQAIHNAKTVVFNLSEEDLRTACEALSKSVEKIRYTPNMLENQMRQLLLAFAEKSPNRVATLDKDLNLEVRRVIKQAIAKGVISVDDRRHEIVWTDTGNRICVIEPGKDSATTMVGFFVTDAGSQVLKTIVGVLKGDKEGKKVKEKVAS